MRANLFGSKSTSIKNSELVGVGECEWDSPPEDPTLTAKSKSLPL